MLEIADPLFAPYDDGDADDDCGAYGCDYGTVPHHSDDPHGHVHGYCGLHYDDCLNGAFLILSLVFFVSLFI